MNRVLACVFLSIGSVLVIYGLNTLPSVSASLGRLFDGGAPEQALWFLLAGLATMMLGLASMFRSPRARAGGFSRSGTRTR